MKLRNILLGGLLGAGLLPSAAYAQIANANYDYNRVLSGSYYDRAETAEDNEEYFLRNRYPLVEGRWQEGYDPISVRLGAFEARPTLSAAVFSTDNLFLDEQNKVEDTALIVEPSVTVQSTWSTHKIGADAIVRASEFSDTSSESATEGGARVFGVLDVDSNTALGGSVAHRVIREPRASIGGVLGAAERVELQKTGVEANAVISRNRIQIRPRLSFAELDYSDVELNAGGFADQDFRDHEETRAAIRGDYAVNRDVAVVGEVEYVDRSYTANSVGTVNRDIDGVIVRGGANFELQQNVRGDVLIGYQSYDSANPAVGTISGLAASANLTWLPTRLTQVSLLTSRSVEDAGAVDASGAIITRGGVRVVHEFKRNILGSAYGSFEERDFESIALTEEQLGLGLGATWKVNDNVHLSANYDYTDRDSDIQGFDENRLSLKLSLFP